jgi:hypothetical protein
VHKQKFDLLFNRALRLCEAYRSDSTCKKSVLMVVYIMGHQKSTAFSLSLAHSLLALVILWDLTRWYAMPSVRNGFLIQTA